MGPVKEKWRMDYTPPVDDTDIHSSEEEEWDSDQSIDTLANRRRGSAGLWTALAVLAVALAVGAAYGYSVLSQHNAELNWLSGRMSMLGAVHNQADKLETMLHEWNTRQASMAARIEKMDSDWKSGLNQVRLGAAEMMANAKQVQDKNLNQNTAELNAKIAKLASRQQTQLALIARLEKRLANTRDELASVKSTYRHQLAALQEQQVSSQQKISSLRDVLSTDQRDFSAQKNQDEAIAQGITLHLTGTDLAHQRFRGWIRIAQTGQTIWVQNHPAALPFVFYSKPDGLSYELVVTKVMPHEISGYLVVPGEMTSRQQDVASSKAVPKSDQGSF